MSDSPHLKGHEAAEEALASHLETWAPHCGAPRSVYEGQLNKLLEAVRAAAEERERQLCLDDIKGERLSGETGNESDTAYNMALDHAAEAIGRRSRSEAEG